MFEIEQLIEKLAQEVDGEKGSEDNIVVFTLSTCQWCRRCKRYLSERGVRYRFIDVDKIDPNEKVLLIDYLKSNFQERIAYPFLTCEKGHVVGYDPKKYDKLLEDDSK